MESAAPFRMLRVDLVTRGSAMATPAVVPVLGDFGGRDHRLVFKIHSAHPGLG
jgi:hypothetical protein